MTNITIQYQVDEKKFATMMKTYIHDYIHDTICDELEFMDIDVSCLDSASFYKIMSATIKELCEQLMKENEEEG